MGNARYDGKPLLRLLELYILRSIGELPVPEEQTLEKMAPKLQSMYGGGGQWHEAIAAAVQMPPALPTIIRDIWDKNLEIARANGATLTPQQFAEMFVDRNFAG